jgi:Icc-related predicted phosphoesterase
MFSQMPNTRFFFVTDLHGSDICFRKFLGAARFYEAQALVVGGDITGKEIVAIIEQSDGSFKATIQGRERKVTGKEELEKLEHDIADSGSYPHRTTESEMAALITDKNKLDRLFSQLMAERIKRWTELAEKNLGNSDVKCYICPGNDDKFEIDTALNASSYVVNPDQKVVQLDAKHEMISLGFSNITPWKCPRDISEDELSNKIETLVSQVKSPENCIFNFHCPPLDSGLDTAPHLDDDLRPVFKAGEVEMIPVGSKSVRDAIQRYQPLLGLHGHIHESKGFFKIGRTICLNPGSEYSEGMLRGALVNLHDRGLKNYMFTTG